MEWFCLVIYLKPIKISTYYLSTTRKYVELRNMPNLMIQNLELKKHIINTKACFSMILQIFFPADSAYAPITKIKTRNILACYSDTT